MSVRSLTWRQVNAWRLAQHCLSPHLPQPDVVAATSRTGGIQAQVMSAAELALWVRMDSLLPQNVRSALWQDRTLIKTWAMRGALHLISAADLPLYVAARSLFSTRNWPYFFEYYGVARPLYEAYIAAAPEVLSDQPMTREQFAAALAAHLSAPELETLVAAPGWGTALKPLAWSGSLCFGPNQGRNVTFVCPSKWIGAWQQLEPYAALQEIARRYLRAYGPATPEDFALWWSLRLVPARKLFQSLGDELEPVEVEGWRAVALQATIEQMEESDLSGSVSLLPLFDAYTLGIGRGVEIEPLLPKAYQAKVYRPQGWISAVVLVDGYMRGTWVAKTQGSQTIVKVSLFSPAATEGRQGIEAEVARLGAFLQNNVIVEYALQ